MANGGSRDPGPEQTEVSITVMRDANARTLRDRLPRGLPALIIGVVLFTTVAIGAGVLRPSSPSAPRQATVPGPAGVAAAYGYPLRCLSVTILAVDPSYARADFDRKRSCGRFGWSNVAILHRARGVWRRVLDATLYSCPVPGLPRAVQIQLFVCQ